MMGFGIGRMGLGFRGPRPVPSWVAPGAAFHIKPASGWAWINGREYTSFAALVADPTAASFSRESECYALTSAGTFTRFDSGVPAITDLGLLVEPEETGIAAGSTTPESWGLVASNCAVVGDQIGPINNDAIRMTANGAVAQHFTTTGVANIVSGTSYLFYAIVENLSFGCIQLAGTSSCFGTTVYANFDVSGNGGVGSKGAGAITSGFVKLANARFLIWMTGQATSTASTSPVSIAFIPSSTSSRLNTHASSASVTISARQISTAARWGSPIAVSSGQRTRSAVSFTIKPMPGTYDVTIKFGDGAGDQTVEALIIAAGGHGFDTNLSGRFVTDIVGVAA